MHLHFDRYRSPLLVARRPSPIIFPSCFSLTFPFQTHLHFMYRSNSIALHRKWIYITRYKVQHDAVECMSNSVFGDRDWLLLLLLCLRFFFSSSFYFFLYAVCRLSQMRLLSTENDWMHTNNEKIINLMRWNTKMQ